MSRAGQVAVITGGAGGIGIAAAERWLAEGGSVVAGDVNDAAGRAFAARHPGRVEFVHCDTRRRADLEACIAAAQRLGEFRLMFNNAGIAGPLDNPREAACNWEALQRIVDINVSACCLGTYLALDAFGERGGTVITTASMAGLLPLGAPPMYSMSKAANVHFTRAVASSLGEESKKRVYALCPSYTATALGPSPAQIKAALGGVLLAEHQAEGFMLLAKGDLPNGSVMRVTARQRGAQVVWDLVEYGKEQGGPLPARAGVTVKTEALVEYTGPMEKEGGLDLSKL